MKRRLAALFNVRPGEESQLLYLVAYAFFASAAYVFFSTAAYALFLAEFTAAKLPFTYIVSAVAVSLAGAVYAWLEGRTRLVRLVAATLVLMLIVTALVVAGLELTGTPMVIFAVVIWCDVAFTLTGLGYWALAGRLFDIRQGKRLFGLVTAGELAAGTAAGLSVPLVLRFADTPMLLWLGTAGLGLCLFSLRSIAAKFREDLEADEEEPGAAPEEEDADGGRGWRDMLRGRYVLLTLAFNAIWIIAYYFLDFAYLDQAEKRFPDEDELAGFLGVFNGVSQGAQLMLTAFFSGRLISRYGLKAGLIFPTASMAVALLALGLMRGALGDVALVFWLLIATKLAYGVLSSALINPASRLLYQPLDADRRGTFLTFVDSILTPLGGGLAGLLLLAVAGGADPLLRLVVVMVAVWLAWTAVSWVLEREYAVALLAALNRRDLEGEELAFDDATSVAVLRGKLGSSRVGEVLYAVELLERLGDEALPGLLIETLDHPAAEVRLEALAGIERLSVADAAPRIRELMAGDDSPAVRARAIRGYCELGAFDDIEEVAPYLDDDDPEVAQGTLVGLLRGGGIAGVLVAGNRLLEMQAGDAGARARAAGALGEIGVRSFYQPLLKLLEDPEAEVLRAALEAAAKIGHPRLWPPVVANLFRRQCRRATKRALIAGGEAAVPALAEGFARSDGQREARMRILEICGRIDGAESTEFLFAQLDVADGDLRLRALAALGRLGWSAAPEEAPRIRQGVDFELHGAGRVLALLAELEPDEPRFRRALEIEVAAVAERVLHLLSFIYDAGRIESARENLAHGSRERHAYALELLDTALATEVKEPLLPLLSDRPPGDVLAEMGKRYKPPAATQWQRLGELFDEPRKPFTRAGVLAYAGFTRADELSSAARAGLDDGEAIVRESARWALAQMADAAGRAESGSKEETMAKLLTLERVVFLKAVGIFSDIPEDILAAVAEVATEKQLAAGEPVFSKGDLGHHLYVIVNGRVCIHDGDRVVVVLDEGEVFGEMAILESEPRSMSARIEDDALLLVLGREQFWELMDDYSSITRGVVKMLCDRLRERTAEGP